MTSTRSIAASLAHGWTVRGMTVIIVAAVVAVTTSIAAVALEPTDAYRLRLHHGGGPPDTGFTYGRLGDVPLTGDWNGDGRTTVGIIRDGVWHLRNTLSGGNADTSFIYGRRGDLPITGDWNGDGTTTVGIVRDAMWHLRHHNAGGAADVTFRFGRPGDIPITGDWNADGRTTIGVVRDGRFLLRSTLAGGDADADLHFGRATDTPLTGDWNRDGRTTIGVKRGDTYYLRNGLSGGGADHTFRFGHRHDAPLSGDWNGDRRTSVGAIRYGASHAALHADRTTCGGDAWSDGDRSVVDHVVPPSFLDRPGPTGPVADLARIALLEANRFTLGTHYQARYGTRTNHTYLDVLGDSATPERAIRLPASTALAAAVSLRTGAYEASEVGRSHAFATEYAVWLTRSVACQHRAITSSGWGGQWQSAFWAYLAGTAGWLMWDQLAPDDRFFVARMVESEANRFIADTYQVPYWKDKDGTENFVGDSKAEENSWNANVLQLATAMMPDHPNDAAWRRRNIELVLSSYATEEDAHSAEVVHGRALSEWLDGFNIESDGTVVNHGRLNPDYMSTIHQNWSAAMTYALAGMPTPTAAFHNGALVYGALSTVSFTAPPYLAPGGTFYVPGNPRLYYPDGYSWGPNRPAPFFNLDVMAHAFAQDALAARPAAEWAQQHGREQLRLQARAPFGDGRTYIEPRPDEDRYFGREEYVAQILAFAWLATYVDGHGLWHADDGDHTTEEFSTADRDEAFQQLPDNPESGDHSP